MTLTFSTASRLAVLMAPRGEVFVSCRDVWRRAGGSGEEAVDAFFNHAAMPEIPESPGA